MLNDEPAGRDLHAAAGAEIEEGAAVNPNVQRRTRILVVDDHPIVRLGIRGMLAAERDLEVCGEAESADAAKELILGVHPNLAIIDLSLAEGTGLDLIRSLRESMPTLPVTSNDIAGARLIRRGVGGGGFPQTEAKPTPRSALGQGKC